MSKFGITVALTVEATSEEDASDKIKEAMSRIGVSSNDFEIKDSPELVEEDPNGPGPNEEEEYQEEE